MPCEHGLICTGHSVREILAGTKTQTRRVMKPQPVKSDIGGLGLMFEVPGGCASARAYAAERCPYGGAGDRLWVREAFRFPRGMCTNDKNDLDKQSPKRIAAMCLEANYPKPWCPTRYEADGTTDNYDGAAEWGAWGKLRPSIFMPRWASRIDLDVLDIRVERVQDISGADVRAEGVFAGDERTSDVTLRSRFGVLWDSINRKRAPWAENPWVWVITFRRTR